MDLHVLNESKRKHKQSMATQAITLIVFFIPIFSFIFNHGGIVFTASASTRKLLQDDQGIRAAYWNSFGDYPASAIDTSYFSHVYYAFLLPSPTTYELDITSNDMQKLPELSNAAGSWNPAAKTLLSIGGGGGGDLPDTFSRMASQESSRKSFIDSTIKVARDYGFDGVDLDWEYPDNESDMSNLGLLLKEWREALENEARETGSTRLVLASAVYYATKVSLNGEPQLYPIQAITQYLDWVGPMCYDYHGTWENFTGPHSALYDPDSDLSSDFGIGAWIQAGVPPNQIVMGLPLYGRTWSLENPNVNNVGARAVGAGPGVDGALDYSGVVDFNKENDATVVFDDTRVSYYSYSGVSWVSYDDVGSIQRKVRYARDRSLGGYFFWALGQDLDWTISSAASQAWLN